MNKIIMSINSLKNVFLSRIYLLITPILVFNCLTIQNSKATEYSSGTYFTGGFGKASINEATWKAVISNTTYEGTLDFETGSGWEAGLGHDFGSVRTEVTFYTSNNDIDGISALKGNTNAQNIPVNASATGNLNTKNIFVSSYIDLNSPGKENKISPYFGGGIGITQLDIDNIQVDNQSLESANVWLFGYQAKIGITYSVTNDIDFFGEGALMKFNDLGLAGEQYGLESNPNINYNVGFRLKL